MALCLLCCGPEDIELAPANRTPPPPEDCSAAIPEGTIAARPPMGWNGYNAFGCDAGFDETMLRANVDALVSSGMQSAGYHYVNFDDCWELERTEDGRREFDPARLPGGVTAFSEHLHARGLSLGIRAPVRTCLGIPGTDGYEALDAATYAAWGVDYVKAVGCGAPELAVRTLAEQLELTGRPMVLSLAAEPFAEWMPEVANLWRTSEDAEPTWTSIVTSIDETVPLAAYARPGAFNDPDMLEIGNGTLTLGEKRAQFSVWSILAAPLIAGNDLTTMTEETLSVLTNGRLIALNQDPLGLQAALIRREGGVEILAKPLAECGARAAVLWNRSDADVPVSVERLRTGGAGYDERRRCRARRGAHSSRQGRLPQGARRPRPISALVPTRQGLLAFHRRRRNRRRSGRARVSEVRGLGRRRTPVRKRTRDGFEPTQTRQCGRDR
jgi:alpha-galactosidase